MSSEIPDEWFRPAGDDAGAVGATDPSGHREHPSAPPARPTGPATTPPPAAPAAVAPERAASHSVGVLPEPPARPRRRRGLGVLGAVLGLAALAGVGLVVGDRLLGHAPSTTTTDPQLSAAPVAGPSSSAPTATATPWSGPVTTVRPVRVTATCTAPSKEGYDGRPVPSDASRVLDGDLSTGWRCDGDGQGEGLTFTFPRGTRIVGVRMTNGYTKDVSGASLYGQYRRLTTVTWTFGSSGGAYFLQTLAPDRPSLQEIRIPETDAGEGLQLQVASTTSPGSTEPSRDAVVVTEVQFLVREG